MTPAQHQQALESLLLAFHSLWHPQPFCELRPAWCDRWPALAADLLALSETSAQQLNDHCPEALHWLARYFPELAELIPLVEVAPLASQSLPPKSVFWDRDIPGRKRAQIEAFAAAARSSDRPVLDWCGGKGHLGRLLAQSWAQPVHSLDVDATLCHDGEALARRCGVAQDFIHADALQVEAWPRPEQHAVALHACGELHRRLIRQAASRQAMALDIAPCCYYRGVERHYQPLSGPRALVLTRDDTRLAVTETVTAKARETRYHEQAMAWKLGFDAYRRQQGDAGYRSFKPVPQRWLRASFAEFMDYLAPREGLPPLPASGLREFEQIGWQRRHEVRRYSIVRHAFRRAIEIWLALDLAVYLENQGYSTRLGCFCERQLTPRNLLLSAWRR